MAEGTLPGHSCSCSIGCHYRCQRGGPDVGALGSGGDHSG